jgi:hypothetical protein
MNIDTDGFDNVEQFQFCQAKVDEVILRVVDEPEFNEGGAGYLSRGVRRSCGDDGAISTRHFDNVQLAARGKYRHFAQNLPIRFGAGETLKNEQLHSDMSG